MAATLAYVGLVGRPPDVHDAVAMQRVLNDVAHALAIVAPIHEYDEVDGKLAAIDPSILIDARFEHGGAVLIGPNGKEHKQPVIQRRELDSAIALLAKTALAHSLRTS